MEEKIELILDAIKHEAKQQEPNWRGPARYIVRELITFDAYIKLVDGAEGLWASYTSTHGMFPAESANDLNKALETAWGHLCPVLQRQLGYPRYVQPVYPG